MKQIVVLGCGRFGMSLAITLERLGNEVMVVDKDEEIINSIANKVTHAIVCDVSVDGSLKELGLTNFDICVVAIGSDYKTSIIATVEARELGIPKIIAKATDSVQAMVLKKIGK
ncbi:potassium channel family protein [Parvimonas sp. G1425]